MSLILDALRKSDMERSRQKAPDIAATGGTAQQRGTPRWMWPVIALLVVNALFLGYLLMKPAAQTAGTGGTAVPQLAAPTPSPAPAMNLPPVDVATNDITRIPATKADVRSLIDESTRDVAAESATVSSAARAEPAAAAAAEAPPDEREDLPSYSALAANGEIQLAPVSLELHVYSDQPSARFAFINGQKVTEGDRLTGGGRVDKITRYGVVLEHQGRRFVLARD